MSPAPPPEIDPASVTVHIGRNGQVIGKWPLSEIRQLILAGQIRTDDHYWCKGETDWKRLLPEPPASAKPFPFLEDERPFWFIRGSFVYGPRAPEEIDALLAAGWLTEESLVTLIGLNAWMTLGELLQAGGEQPEEPSSAWAGAGRIFLKALHLKLQGVSTLAVVADHFLTELTGKKK